MDITKFSKTPNITESIIVDSTMQSRSVANNTENKKPLRDLFLEEEDFEDAEVFYPSKMNEENPNLLVDKEVETKNLVQPF